jgi:putative ABC transport system permease protein
VNVRWNQKCAFDFRVLGDIMRGFNQLFSRGRFDNERKRDAWKWPTLESVRRDVRYALRQLKASPAFTLTVIFTLTLGIGTVTAVFSVVDATLLRPLPYKNGGELMELARTSPGNSQPVLVSGADYLDWRERNHVFVAIAAYGGQRLTRIGPAGSEMVHAMRTSTSFFSSILGIQPQYGRGFRPNDDQPENSHVVLLGSALAEQWFGSGSNAVGQNLTLNGQNFTVIGVLPNTFKFELSPNVGLWIPLVLRPGEHRGSNEYYVLGRLRQQVNLLQAETEMKEIAKQLQKDFPKDDADQGILVIPYLHWLNRGGSDQLALVFFGAVLLVLFIAIANLAGLVVARSADRSKQFALRIAIGATRAQLVRMLLIESIVLSTIGGIAGTALAFGLTIILRAEVSAYLPRTDLIHVDGRILFFALALSLGSGLLIGLVPAIGASRPDLNSELKGGGITNSGRPSNNRMRSILIVTQIALSLVLVASAGLLLRSMINALTTDPGYEPEHLLTFWLMPSEAKYPNDDSLSLLYHQILQNVGALPGVQSVALSNTLPPTGNGTGGNFIVAKHPPQDLRHAPNTIFDAVSPSFFKTMEIPVIRGRVLSEQDNHPKSLRNIVISNSLARRYLGTEDPISQSMKFSVDGFNQIWTVVGVVGDTRYFGWDQDDGIFVYFPYAALGGRDRIGIAVRTDVDPTTMRSEVEHAVWSADKELPLFDFGSVSHSISESFAPRRFSTALLGFFAGTAVFLAAIGLFGLLANLVARQTREIGVRMALGAQRRDILRSVIMRSLRLTIAGICIGFPCALFAGKLTAGLLYNATPLDPLILILAVATMIVVALGTSYLPARRASAVDPIQALRSE